MEIRAFTTSKLRKAVYDRVRQSAGRMTPTMLRALNAPVLIAACARQTGTDGRFGFKTVAQ